MPLLTLLLLLQAPQDPAASEDARVRGQFEIGPIAEYWFPRFKGSMRVDGAATSGSTLKFVNDLGLPDDASIPILGGGSIGAALEGTTAERAHLFFVAEHWSHSWAGHETLSRPVTLGDHSFAAGSPVDSRFTLQSVTLDAGAWFDSRYLAGGGEISIQVRSARLRMDGPVVHGKETIDDVYWGAGIFFEAKPVPFAFAGIALRGYTSFGDAGETGAGDFRIYGGFRWGPFRLEGGFRTIVYDRDTETKSLNYTLYGSYALFSVILRF